MKKLLLTLCLLPVCVFASDKTGLDVETAYKNGTIFVERNQNYYALNSYVKGVLSGYAEARYNWVFSPEEEEKVASCQGKSYEAISQMYDCLARTSDNKELVNKMTYLFVFENIQENFKMKHCMLSQTPENVLTRVFYAYVEGKIKGNMSLEKAVIEQTEQHCYLKVEQERESELKNKAVSI